MLLKRFVLFAIVAGAVLLLGLVAADFGSGLCSPAALPGDETWTQWQRYHQAVQLVFGAWHAGSGFDCFTGNTIGGTFVRTSTQTIPALIVLAFLFAGWFAAGSSLYRWWLRQRGNHTIIAGEPEAIRAAAREARRHGGVVFLAINAENLEALRRRFWLSLVEPIAGPGGVAKVLARLGANKAREVIAASASDVSNIEISEAAIRIVKPDASSRPDIVTVIEQAALRNLRAHELARDAAARRADLIAVSFGQMQIRLGIAAAIPYQFDVAGAERVHVVISGAGPLLQALVMQIARQAYELKSKTPILTIVQFGRDGFSVAVIERLQAATAAADIRIISGDASDAVGFERAIAQIGFDQNPIFAIHCAEEHDGEAEILARRWEKSLRQLGQAVPPIVIYPNAAIDEAAMPIGESGMWRWSPPIDITAVRDVAKKIDRHARAIHDDFLAKERARLGAGFPNQASHAPWPQLPAEFQDDNRAVADHLDAKLMMIGCRSVAGVSLPAHALSKEEIELLANIEHARWMAGKSLDGWKYGTPRDDKRRLNPSMLEYDKLSESDKQKDRNNIVLVPQQLALVNERVVEDFACAVVLAEGPARSDQFDTLIAPLLAWRDRNPVRHPVIWIAPDNARMLSLAEALGRAGLSLGVIHDRNEGARSAIMADSDYLSRLARIMKSADKHLILAPEAGLNAPPGERRNHFEFCEALVIESDMKPAPPHRAIAKWDSEKGFVDAGWLA